MEQHTPPPQAPPGAAVLVQTAAGLGLGLGLGDAGLGLLVGGAGEGVGAVPLMHLTLMAQSQFCVMAGAA